MGDPADNHNITSLLKHWGEGDDRALERLSELVYADLRRLAASYLRNERPGHTLAATALVHEMFLQIGSIRGIEWQARGQFIATAAQMMRRILVDHARRRNAGKRDSSQYVPPSQDSPDEIDVIAVDAALTKMKALHPRHVQMVELRFFGGLTAAESAEALGLSERTMERDWRFAKAWLQNELDAGKR